MLKKTDMNPAMTYLIKGGRVIDPANGLDDTLDILIAGGRVERIGKDLTVKAGEVINASGHIVAPGFVDMHTHLREPGREDEETVGTGTRAAIRGGFTSVACMPNTDPPIDSAGVLKTLKGAIDKDAACNVFIVGAITKGRAGKELADIKGMKKDGVVALSDDGSSVESPGLMLEALKAAKANDLLLIEHCEDAALSANGVINKGFAATKMGLRGIPRESEYEIVKRDLELAKKTSARIHIAHVSCKESVDLIRRAKREGVKVSAETAPHYFALTEGACVTYDTNTKMNPPLRTKEDVEAIKGAIADATIDAIATDHAPHTDSEKDVEFDLAPFGIIGLETAFSIAAMELVETKVISWQDLVAKMSTTPAKILGIDRGSLAKGSIADIVIIDPAAEYIYRKDSIESKSRNSPFIDWALKAKALSVFVGGRLVMQDELFLI